MSIIYKALQKTQKNRNRVSAIATPKNRKRAMILIDLGIITLIGILLFVVLHAYYPQAKNYFTAKKTVKAPIMFPLINETEYRSKHVLNGTFISDTTKLALINNRYCHVGENIDGMKVVSIDDNLVTLQNEKQTFILKVMV